jgi:hypothetical protein
LALLEYLKINFNKILVSKNYDELIRFIINENFDIKNHSKSINIAESKLADESCISIELETPTKVFGRKYLVLFSNKLIIVEKSFNNNYVFRLKTKNISSTLHDFSENRLGDKVYIHSEISTIVKMLK